MFPLQSQNSFKTSSKHLINFIYEIFAVKQLFFIKRVKTFLPIKITGLFYSYKGNDYIIYRTTL